MTVEMMAILVIINSIGIGSVIAFVGKLWYKTERNHERNNDFANTLTKFDEKLLDVDYKNIDSINKINLTLSDLSGILRLLTEKINNLEQKK